MSRRTQFNRIYFNSPRKSPGVWTLILIGALAGNSLFAKGANIDQSVDRYLDSLNEYSRQTAGKNYTSEQLQQKRKEIVAPAHEAVHRDFISVMEKSLQARGVRTSRAAAANPTGEKSKFEFTDQGMRVTRTDAEGKTISKPFQVTTRGVEGAGGGEGRRSGEKALNAKKENGVEVFRPDEPEVVVSGEQDVKRLTFPGKKKQP